MQKRLFLLALGRRTRDPYERGAARAVRAYLVWLLLPIFLMCVFTAFISCAIMSVPHAFLFSLLPVVFWAGVFLGNEDTWLPMGTRETLVLHPHYTRVAEVFSGRHQIAAKIPVFLTNVGKLRATLISHHGRPAIIIDQKLVGRCGPQSINAIIGHEIAHLVLPLGLKFFSFATVIQSRFVDRLLLCAEIRNFNGAGQQLLWRSIAAFCAGISSHSGERRREYACDAIAALMLRDVLPLIVAFERIAVDGEQIIFPSIRTHPTLSARINALLDINDAVSHTR